VNMRELFSFTGGVKPASHKTESNRASVIVAPLPAVLTIPLRQNAGLASRPLVQAGDKVLKGQTIAGPGGSISVAIHAPTSGTVRGVETHAIPHPSGLLAPCVVIEADGEDRWMELFPVDPHVLSADELRLRLRDAGVVGLGGATFPSHVKTQHGASQRIDTLILNGAECEPFITCDDMLMRTKADEILEGAAILAHIASAKRILVGIEDNKPEAVAAMTAAAGKRSAGIPIDVIAVPTRYPAGGEKQLIRVLTGIEVPFGKLGPDFGVQCFNVGTAWSVARALLHGEPMLSRLVTVAGNVEHPGNFEVRIGTSMANVLKLAGPKQDTDRTLMGGPMMGFALPTLDVPVVKATNCILAGSKALFPPPGREMPCIRCGSCARACPMDLQPFEMYWFSRARILGKAQEYHLFDCIECGCCAYVCPSRIPLVDYFRFAKSEIRAEGKGSCRHRPRTIRIPPRTRGARKAGEGGQARRQGSRNQGQARAAAGERGRRRQEGPDCRRAGARARAEVRHGAQEHRQPDGGTASAGQGNRSAPRPSRGSQPCRIVPPSFVNQRASAR
jgi:Na+-translocating ferredoxin:NAD+ oxidoreductase subunit C